MRDEIRWKEELLVLYYSPSIVVVFDDIKQ